jgi:hypothetical protein
VRDSALFAELAQVVTEALASGKAVEVEGLGVFYPDPVSGVRFEDCRGPSVFLAYAKEDLEVALRLHDALREAGFRPWIDVRKLLPGQNWPRAIEMAIQNADFFVACFSQRAVVKRGGFQAEIRYALDCAHSLPLDDIYMVPLRLDACHVPRSVAREYHYIDLFPDWQAALRRLTGMIHAETRRRREARFRPSAA